MKGRAFTVVEAQRAGSGSYVVVAGNIVVHQRSDFFTLRDPTGEFM